MSTNSEHELRDVTEEELPIVEGGSITSAINSALQSAGNLLKKFAQTSDLITGNMK